jgi:hypothetical protein
MKIHTDATQRTFLGWGLKRTVRGTTIPSRGRERGGVGSGRDERTACTERRRETYPATFLSKYQKCSFSHPIQQHLEHDFFAAGLTVTLHLLECEAAYTAVILRRFGGTCFLCLLSGVIIQPWRWRKCSSETSANSYHTTGVTSQKKILFLRIAKEKIAFYRYYTGSDLSWLRMTTHNLGQDIERSLKTAPQAKPILDNIPSLYHRLFVQNSLAGVEYLRIHSLVHRIPGAFISSCMSSMKHHPSSQNIPYKFMSWCTHSSPCERTSPSSIARVFPWELVKLWAIRTVTDTKGLSL